ncbi:ATP-binding protein [Alteromonas portus]|uniref:ATP-binding protein n=1 Tax=Alteromonas portus TaxID=2565549 RepID=UPI003BF8942A
MAVTKKKLAQLAKNKLLILEEWEMEKLSARQADDLFDVMKERYQKTSIIIVSQSPVIEWCKLIGNPLWQMQRADMLIATSFYW